MTELELYEYYRKDMSRVEERKETNSKRRRHLAEEEEFIRQMRGKSVNTIEVLSAQWGSSKSLFELQDAFSYMTNKFVHDYDEKKEFLDKELKNLHREEEEIENTYKKEKQKLEESESSEEKEDEEWG